MSLARFVADFEELLDGALPHDAACARLLAWNRAPWSGAALAAAARAVRRRGALVHAQVHPLVDTCGTGGDGARTVNLSTAAALVVAAAGGAVAKHGNRAVTSAVGSADVLEALGATIDLPPERAARLLDATGFAFLFAPRCHPALRSVAAARRAVATRTLFNALGPLCNPAGASCQLLGTWDASLTRPLAEALRELGSERALVVHCAGLDELGLHAPTLGHQLKRGAITEFRVAPHELGLAAAPIAALAGGDAATNARRLRDAIAAEGATEGAPRAATTVAIRDAVALNAAAALQAAGLAPTLRDALALARGAVASGAATRTLDRFVVSSRRAAAALEGVA